MKHLWKFLLMLFLAAPVWAGTTTLTGTVLDASNNPATSGFVRFTIQPLLPNVVYRDAGTGIIIRTSSTCNIQSDGTILDTDNITACQMFDNDTLSPANSFYKIELAPGGVVSDTFFAFITGASADISTLALATLSTAVPPASFSITTNPTITGILVTEDIAAKAASIYDIGTLSVPYQEIFSDAITVGQLDDVNIVDGMKFTTCQAAEDDLGVNPGLVVIPSTYAGADCTAVSANVVILDLRATAAVTGTSSQSKYLLFSGNATPLDDIGGLFPSFPRRGLMLIQDEIADSGAGSSGVVESAEDGMQVAIRTLDPHKDVAAFYGQCIVDVATDGGGCWGANFQAIGGANLDTKLSGIEIDIVNQNTGGALGTEPKNGVLLNAFFGQVGQAILVGTGDAGTGRFQNGITFNDNSMNETTGAFMGAATGTYNNGIDFSLTTFNGEAIRLRNTEGVEFRGTGATHASIRNDATDAFLVAGGANGTTSISFRDENANEAVRITGASTPKFSVETGINNNGGGFKHTRIASGTTAASLHATASATWTFGTAFTDTNYTITCTVDNPTGVPLVANTDTKAAASINIVIMAGSAAAASGTLNCIAVHD